jgi:hypothetical protein
MRNAQASATLLAVFLAVSGQFAFADSKSRRHGSAGASPFIEFPVPQKSVDAIQKVHVSSHGASHVSNGRKASVTGVSLHGPADASPAIARKSAPPPECIGGGIVLIR